MVSSSADLRPCQLHRCVTQRQPEMTWPIGSILYVASPSCARPSGIVGIRRVRRSRRLGVAAPELWRTQHRHRRCADVNGVAPRRR